MPVLYTMPVTDTDSQLCLYASLEHVLFEVLWEEFLLTTNLYCPLVLFLEPRYKIKIGVNFESIFLWTKPKFSLTRLCELRNMLQYRKIRQYYNLVHLFVESQFLFRYSHTISRHFLLKIWQNLFDIVAWGITIPTNSLSTVVLKAI